MSELSAISLASTTVGFIGFAFTIFTFLRVFWETILTLLSAPKQMRGYLDNLRLEVHNERAYFKSALRRTRSRSRSVKKYHEDVQPLRILDSVSDNPYGVILVLFNSSSVQSLATCQKSFEFSERSDYSNNYSPK